MIAGIAKAMRTATAYMATVSPMSEKVSPMLGSLTSSPRADESTRHGSATLSSRCDSSRSNSGCMKPSLAIAQPSRIGSETVTISSATLVKLIFRLSRSKPMKPPHYKHVKKKPADRKQRSTGRGKGQLNLKAPN